MEPRIQYAQTNDGVSIAYWTLGEGTPLVFMPGWVGHVQMEWQSPTQRRWLEALAQKRKLVHYDRRGSGLSERDVIGYSLDAHVLDLEAVVDRLGMESFALFAPSFSGQVAIAYATRHPERVSRLILWCTSPRGSDSWQSSRAQAFRAIRVTDWELYTETVIDLGVGVRLGEEERRAAAALVREAVTWESYRAFMEGG